MEVSLHVVVDKDCRIVYTGDYKACLCIIIDNNEFKLVQLKGEN